MSAQIKVVTFLKFAPQQNWIQFPQDIKTNEKDSLKQKKRCVGKKLGRTRDKSLCKKYSAELGV